MVSARTVGPVRGSSPVVEGGTVGPGVDDPTVVVVLSDADGGAVVSTVDVVGAGVTVDVDVEGAVVVGADDVDGTRVGVGGVISGTLLDGVDVDTDGSEVVVTTLVVGASGGLVVVVVVHVVVVSSGTEVFGTFTVVVGEHIGKYAYPHSGVPGFAPQVASAGTARTSCVLYPRAVPSLVLRLLNEPMISPVAASVTVAST